jgi:hypothetical protein
MMTTGNVAMVSAVDIIMASNGVVHLIDRWRVVAVALSTGL